MVRSFDDSPASGGSISTALFRLTLSIVALWMVLFSAVARGNDAPCEIEQIGYPFLEGSVVKPPGSLGRLEEVGLWKPDEAIRLLVERGREATAGLAHS